MNDSFWNGSCPAEGLKDPGKRRFLRRECGSDRKLVSGFTLVEIMVSLTVLVILLLISAQVIGQVQRTWSTSAAKISQFREARIAFDIMTRNLTQATLNTYWDYDFNYLSQPGATLAISPQRYLRKSDLNFVTGKASDLVSSSSGGGASSLPGHAVFFQAPLGVVQDPAYAGLDNLLCGRGYFVQYGDDQPFRPPFVSNTRYRFRLMEYSPPAERNLVYAAVSATDSDQVKARKLRLWFANAGSGIASSETSTSHSVTRPIAENIIGLIISPRVDAQTAKSQSKAPTYIAKNYAYDSAADEGSTVTNEHRQGTQHLLPPEVRLALIAIDEASASRMAESGSGSAPDLIGQSSASFDDAEDMEKDLRALEEKLAELRINFRIFTATVPLRNSKWSM